MARVIGCIGSLVCRLPLPPGSLTTLWGADERYEQTYLSDFPGFYKTADAGFVEEDGYVYVMTRTDDVINDMPPTIDDPSSLSEIEAAVRMSRRVAGSATRAAGV